MHKLRAALAAAAVACAAAVTVTAGPASAAGPTILTTGVQLPINSIAEVAVDPVHEQVLVTDSLSGTVNVLSYFGGPQNSIGVGQTAWGVTFSADYATAYVAVPDEHEIAAFDARTMRLKRTYGLAGEVWPRHVKVVAGKVWFSSDGGGLNSLDPASGEVKPYSIGVDTSLGARLLTAPGAPGLLVAALANQGEPNDGFVAAYDVSDGTAVQTSKGRFGDVALRDIALTPDGATLIAINTGIGVGPGIECQIWKAPVAEPAKFAVAYDNKICRPQAVDINKDGRVAFGYGSVGAAPTVAITAAGSEVPAEQFTTPRSEDVWKVVWEPDGDRLFTFGNYGQDWWIFPIHGSAPAVRTTMTVTGPAVAAPGTVVQIKGKISRPGAVVTLTRSYGPSSQALKEQVDSAGSDDAGEFVLTDLPRAESNIIYTVTYGGDSINGPVTASIPVKIARSAPALTLTPNNTVNNYGSTVTMTAHLGPTHTHRTVEIWADPYGTDPLRLLRKTNVDAKGNLTASLKLTRTTAVQVKFAGDDRYAPVSARSVLNTRVALNLQPSRQYKAAKIGSVPYRFYRANVHPYFLTTMTPYPGRKQRLTIEAYSGGKWKAQRVLYLPLNSAGQSAFTLTGTHPVGGKFRARTDYVTTSSGDSVNYTTGSAYYYFTFTK
ncbi:hypothetical protein AB0J83_04130 [Actinoplanes sp. NPDC049596]|uniref:YncE family protein n=1 Tax=unclassified Actinoplanes TaxID=2626549 RepID=UPI003442E012